jgi:putative flippase GtrA
MPCASFRAVEGTALNTDGPQRSVRQAVRFGLVGLVNTTIDFGIFSTLRLLDVPVILSNVASTSTGMAFSFLVNRRFVFSAVGASWKRQAALFFLGTAFSMYVLQNLAIVGFLCILPAPAEAAAAVGRWFDIRPSTAMTLIRSNAAKLGATAVSLVWNFSFYRWIVFVPSPTSPTSPASAPIRIDEHH